MKTANIVATTVILTLGAGAITASAGEHRRSDYIDYSQNDYNSAFNYGAGDVTRRQMKKNYRKFSSKDFQKYFSGSKAHSRAVGKSKYRTRNRRHVPYYDRPLIATDYRCKRPRQIYRMVRRQGWSDFTRLRLQRYFIKVKARQRNGLQYRLKLDRCTGVIISTRLVWRNYWMSSLFRYGYPLF